MRYPAVAGMFYPEEREELLRMLREFLSVNVDGNGIKAVIVPHAGYIYSGKTAGYGFSALKNSNHDNFFVFGPSHYYQFYFPVEPEDREWLTPLGSLNLFHLGFPTTDEPFRPEHSVEVKLPFLQYINPEAKIGIALVSLVEDKERAISILEKHKGAYVVSSDLSHYYPYEEAKRRDKKTIDYILKLDVEGFAEYGDACGKESILLLMELAKLNGWKPRLLDYRTSGDTAGPKDSVVGYAAIGFYE
jgi:AmmeMemoRadiSam system protein B